MKKNLISNTASKILIGSMLLAASSVSVFASEVTGTVSTGLGNSGVSGVVIQAPTASPVSGTYSATQSVLLSSPSSLSIYYTVDGSVPSCAVGTLYTGAISVTSSVTVKAVACYTNNMASSVASHAYVVSAPVAVSTGGGGGGGGGGYSTYVPALPTVPATSSLVFLPKPGCAGFTGFSTTTNQPCSNVTATGGIVLGASASIFTKDLSIGSRGQDVTELQKILIAEGFLKSAATGYFGALTKQALTAWQIKNNLLAGGSFLKVHRDFLTRPLASAQLTETSKPAEAIVKKSFVFLSDLRLGTRGSDVTELQKILVSEKLLVTTVFGTFGPATKNAVIAWQIKNKLPGTGYFGAASRAFMNTKN